MTLTRDAIVTTALSILDTYGLPDLTMRRVASALSVQPSALYWHFPSKQALLAAVADAIIPSLPPFHGRDLTRVQLWAARLHTLLGRHRDAAELVWSVLSLRRWESSIAYPVQDALREAGLEDKLARSAAEGLLHLVLGQAFTDDQRRQAVQLNLANDAPTDSTTMLDDAVALFVAGIEARMPC